MLIISIDVVFCVFFVVSSFFFLFCGGGGGGGAIFHHDAQLQSKLALEFP